jgi:beta-phosphoglucomutase-like phosphatase (HAD superfamily)
MLNRAFLFDVDGVIVDSHKLQSEAMQIAMKEISLKFGLGHKDEPNLHLTLLKLFSGGTEQEAVKSIQKMFPLFQQVLPELFKCAWSHYYHLASSDASFGIKTTIDLLEALNDIGFKICLVSNSKRVDIERYCNILGLNKIIQKGFYVGLEDFNGHVKPSAIPYLIASNKMGVSPEHCVVFEDSETGVIAGKNAKMYVVGLHRHSYPESLTAAGADEVVTNVFHANIVINSMYENIDYHALENNIETRFVTVQNIDLQAQEKLVAITYKIYSKLFAGRKESEWREKIIDKKDFQTRIGLFYCQGELGGYAIFKTRKLSYHGENRLVALASAGTIESFRGNGALLQFYQIELRRLIIANPYTRLDVFDNFLGFSGYSLALRTFRQTIPSSKYPKVDPSTLEYMQFLAKEIGYTKANVPNQMVYKSASSLFMSATAKQKFFNSQDVDCRYFVAQTNLTDGHGLIAISTISLANMLPILSSSLRGTTKHASPKQENQEPVTIMKSADQDQEPQNLPDSFIRARL